MRPLGASSLWRRIPLLLAAVVGAGAGGLLPDPLADWLARQTLRLPRREFTVGRAVVSVRDMACTGLVIGDLRTRSPGPTLSLAFEASGAALRCAGGWTITMMIDGLPRTPAGTVAAALANVTMSGAIALTTGGDPPLPAAVSVPACECAVGAVSLRFGGDGDLARGVLDVLHEALERFLRTALPFAACRALEALAPTEWTDRLRQLSAQLRPLLAPAPDPMEPSAGSSSTEWPDSILLAALDAALQDIGGAHPADRLNALVRLHTNGTGAVGGDPRAPPLPLPLPGVGAAEARLTSLTLAGVDHVTSAEALGPCTPHSLLQRLGFQNVTLELRGVVTLTPVAGTDALQEPFLLRLELDTLHVESALLLAVSRGARLLTFDQLMRPRCLLDAVTAVALWRTNVSASVRLLALEFPDGPLARAFGDTVTTLLHLALHSLGGAIDPLTTALLVRPTEALLNEQLGPAMAALRRRAGECPAAGETAEKHEAAVHTAGGWAMGVWGALIMVLAGLAVHAEWKGVQDAGYRSLGPTAATDRASYLFHPGLPGILRHGLPLLAGGCVALCVAANTQRAGTVFPTVDVGVRTLHLPSMKVFGIGDVVQNLWAAGVWPLSLMIAWAGGLWGYMKGLGLLYCWVAPRPWLSERHCEWTLMAMEFIGKLSWANCWVLILLQSANRFHHGLPATASHEAVGMDTYVHAEIGMHLFLAYTAASLCVGHVMLAAVRSTRPPRGCNADAEGHYALPPDAINLKGDRSAMLLGAGPRAGLAAAVASLLTILALCCCSDTFTTRIQGAAGLLAEDSPRSYTLITFIAAIPSTNRDPTAPGVRILQATVAALVVVVPAGLLAASLLLLLQKKPQRHLLLVVETLNAWSGLEAFGISLFVLKLELSSFARFIVGDNCQFINAVLRRFLDNTLHGDDICYDARLDLTPQGWLLFGGCVMMVPTMALVVLSAHAALRAEAEPHAAVTAIDAGVADDS